MLVFDADDEVLIWGKEKYHGISGPHGKGELPQGFYSVLRKHVVVHDLPDSFCYKGVCFFIPIQPKFRTERGGFGIHPDGGIHGTLGCVGLQNEDNKKFWKRWLKTPMSRRPKLLYVSGDWQESQMKKIEPMPVEEIKFDGDSVSKPREVKKK